MQIDGRAHFFCGQDVMDITIIGVEPPCPRCRLLHEITHEAVRELGVQADVKKIACTSNAAQKFGRIGSAHDIAQWAGIAIDWDAVHRLAGQGWSQTLDAMLLPCKEKADAEGWLMTPVLLLDGTVACMGYVPDKEHIKAAIQHYLKEVHNI
jgi:hypothetical protein